MQLTRKPGRRQHPSVEGQSERRSEATRAKVISLPLRSEDEFERWLIAALEWERLRNSGAPRPAASEQP